MISFGNFVADTGDIEGRLAVQGSVTLGDGYSIGDQISSLDGFSSYSLIAGSLTWGSGGLYPDGSAASIENAFVADTASVPSYLQDRINGPCDSGDCLSAAFSNAQGCFTNLQNSLASLAENVNATLKYSAIQLTCNGAASRYVASITDDMMAGATWWNLIGCSGNAQWIINVEGSGQVNFHGDSIPTNADNVVYNILGSGRTISVNTGVNGAILAPNNNLNQTGGVIRGVVIAGDIQFALQINRPSCIPTQSAETLVSVGSAGQGNGANNLEDSKSGFNAIAPSILLVLIAALAMMF